MRCVVVISTWTLAALAVGYLLFAPGNGLAHAGPSVAIGLTLLGAAICRQSRDAERSDAADSTR